jgi:hypothetical protein
MKYHVTITETLERTIEVEASDQAGAELQAKAMYTQEDIILDADDFSGVDYETRLAEICPKCSSDNLRTKQWQENIITCYDCRYFGKPSDFNMENVKTS